MWTNTVPLWEVVVRVLVIYVLLLAIVRLAGKREIGELGPLDLLGMLLLSETVSPALTGQDTSLVVAVVAAATLIAATALVGRLTFWSRRLERLVEGTPRDIIVAGRIVPEVARSERITTQDIEVALRQQGLDSVEHVERATVEPNGRISILKQE